MILHVYFLNAPPILKFALTIDSSLFSCSLLSGGALSINSAIDGPPETVSGGAIPEVRAIVDDISLDGVLHHGVQGLEGAALE